MGFVEAITTYRIFQKSVHSPLRVAKRLNQRMAVERTECGEGAPWFFLVFFLRSRTVPSVVRPTNRSVWLCVELGCWNRLWTEDSAWWLNNPRLPKGAFLVQSAGGVIKQNCCRARAGVFQ